MFPPPPQRQGGSLLAPQSRGRSDRVEQSSREIASNRSGEHGNAEIYFNMDRAKEMALKGVSSVREISKSFEEFVPTKFFDAFLLGVIKYFSDFFKDKGAEMGVTKTHPYEAELNEDFREIAAAYATILIKFGDLANPREYRDFHDNLIECTRRVMLIKLDRSNWADLDYELQRLFRSNTKVIKNGDQLALKQQKRETELRRRRIPQSEKGFRNILTQVRLGRLQMVTLELTSQQRSPLISRLLPTPVEAFRQGRGRLSPSKMDKDDLISMVSDAEFPRVLMTQPDIDVT